MVSCQYHKPSFRFRAGQQQLNLSGPYYPPNGSKMFPRLIDLVERHELSELTIDACMVRLDRASLSGLLGFLGFLDQQKISTRFRWLYFDENHAAQMINADMFEQMPSVECEMIPITTSACTACKGC